MASRSDHLSVAGYLRAILFAAGLLLLLSSSAPAQSQNQVKPEPTPIPLRPRVSDSDKPDSPDFGSPESEMRARQNIKAEKKEYDDNVTRAREASQLASELDKTYEAKKSFASEDNKKFERLEKLTKKIRSEAGGSDSDPEVKDIPGVMEAAVKQLADMADDLRKLVEKTPRHVISAAVIDQANRLLGLLQHVRYVR